MNQKAQKEQQAHPGNGIDAVRQQEVAQGQAHDPRGDEDRRPDAGQQSGEEQDLDPVAVEVALDALAFLGRHQPGHEGQTEQARAEDPTQAVEQSIAEDHS